MRILLADGNSTYLKVLNGYLDLFDELNVIGIVNTCQQAVDIVKAQMPEVLLLDLALLETAKAQKVRNLRVLSPSISIIALTMLSSDSHIAIKTLTGVDGVVEKVKVVHDLLPIIRQCQANKSVMCSVHPLKELRYGGTRWRTETGYFIRIDHS